MQKVIIKIKIEYSNVDILCTFLILCMCIIQISPISVNLYLINFLYTEVFKYSDETSINEGCIVFKCFTHLFILGIIFFL